MFILETFSKPFSMHLSSWIDIDPESDFSLYNLPYGIFSSASRSPRVGMAIGSFIIDLAAASKIGLFEDFEIPNEVFYRDSLNDFIELGVEKHAVVRKVVQRELAGQDSTLREYQTLLVRQQNATMHLPVRISDFTDFYSSLEHATNVGRIFRDPEEPLLPNWKHMPVAYHGKASSVVVSGTPVHRPRGQIQKSPGANPSFKETSQLDFELEMGYIIGKSNPLGQPVSVNQADSHVFGMVLLNDWSARDIQKWEYVPLGPFLGKNFSTSVSPWVVPMEALVPFRVDGPPQDPEVLPYLRSSGEQNLDINLEVALKPGQGSEEVICQSNPKDLYWNISQKIAHHTINGCNLRIGDLLGTGTISGSASTSYGSMLELTHAGAKPMVLADGGKRRFLEDFDTITMRAHGQKGNVRVGFGELSGEVLPAIELD